VAKKMKRSLFNIAGIVAIATTISKIFGLLRATIVAAVFGVGAVADAYNYAYIIPGFLLVILGGINGPLHSALVSVLAKRDPSKAAPLVETITTIVGAVLLIVSIALMLGAGLAIDVIAPGLQPQVREITVLQLQIMAPIALFSGLIGIGFGTLNIAQHYWLPSLSPIFSSLAVILGLGWFVLRLGDKINSPEYWQLGAGILAGGTLAGAVWQWLVQLIVQYRAGMGGLRLGFNWNLPGVKEAIAIALPATITTGMTQINLYVDLFFASYIPHAAAGLNYAGLLAQTPKGIITSAILIPYMGVFSQFAIPEKWSDLKQKIRQSIILTALTMLPLGALLIALALPIVRIVYQRQAFDGEASQLVASILMAYGLGAFTSVAVGVLVRVFYALEDGKTPLKIAIANILLNIVLDYFFVNKFGAPGLVLASMGVNLTAMLMMLWCLYRRLHGLALGEWGLSILGLVGASGVGGFAAWGFVRVGEGFGKGFAWQLLEVSVAACLGLGIFAVLANWLRLPEVDLLVRRLQRKS
jgi:putative peptidoglycan lipid II flippase